MRRRSSRTLLQGWQDSPAYGVMQQAQAQGKDFYETVILASIVEREALHDADKPLVAGVYQNRVDGLGGVRTLNSDPVLIYANDTMNLRDLHITQWPDYVFWTYVGNRFGRRLRGHRRSRAATRCGIRAACHRGRSRHPASRRCRLRSTRTHRTATSTSWARTTALAISSLPTYEEHLHNIQLYLGGSPVPRPSRRSECPTPPSNRRRRLDRRVCAPRRTHGGRL